MCVGIFTAILIIISCQRDDDFSGGTDQLESIPETFSEYFGDEVSRDFLGTVIDKNNNPIEGVTITVGNQSVTTDINGTFILNEASVHQRFGYLKAEKAGYIHASRSMVPSNGFNKINIMMLEANVVGTVISGSMSTVALPNGSSVSFEGEFITSDGNPYSGSVDVIMHHLDPTDQDMELQMPGMLYAQNDDGAERMLQTLGMLAVELRGSNGEELNIAQDSFSEIKIPVDNSLLQTAPNSIPLWYFDESGGYWKEEGEATLNGNVYTGQVSHFSFWNCDIPVETVNLCVLTTDQEDNPIGNLVVSVSSNSYGTTSSLTNTNGTICGLVPKNENLELNIFNNDICGDAPIYTQSIGPFTTDSNITIIIPDDPDIIYETVTGIFNDCDGNPVTEGYVQLTYGNQTYVDLVDDGIFEIKLSRCSNDNTFSITGTDYTNLQSTSEINYTFTTPTTNIGTISACNSIDEFIYINIDNSITYTFDSNNLNFSFNWASFIENDSTWNYGPQIEVFAINNEFDFRIEGFLNKSSYLRTYIYNYPYPIYGGDIVPDGFFIFMPWTDFDISGSNNNIIFNLTTLGEIGEYIDINFSGDYEDSIGNIHTINGVVHMLRDY